MIDIAGVQLGYLFYMSLTGQDVSSYLGDLWNRLFK